MEKTKLTTRVVDALKSRDSDYVRWCGQLPGFGVRVRKSGSKTFIAQYDFFGRTKKVTIGQYGETWTVDQAREEAIDILRDAKKGIDRAETKAKRRAEMTLTELCDEYLKRGCALKKASTIATDKSRINRHINAHKIGGMKISLITDSDVRTFRDDIAKGNFRNPIDERSGRKLGGSGTAARTIRLLGGIFSYAVGEKYLEKNPRFGVSTPADKETERFLTMEEFARLGDTMIEAETVGLPWLPKAGPNAKHVPKMAATAREKPDPYAIGAIRLLFLTGCRLGEILNLKWSQVDLVRGIITLAESKARGDRSGKKHILLGDAAMVVLTRLSEMKIEANPYVIVGENKNKPRADLKRPWARIRACAGLNLVGDNGEVIPLRLHDLRHSFASLGAGENFGLPVLGKLLGHKNPKTTQRYAHIADTVERRALRQIDNKIGAATGILGTAEVLDFDAVKTAKVR